MRARVALIALTLAVIVASASSISGAGSSTGDRRQILQVMEDGRTALLRNRPRAACRLLTRHGRERTLGFQVDFAEEGTPVPSEDPRLPQTCEEVVRRERPHIRTLERDIRRARFSIVWIKGARARVRLQVDKPYGPTVNFWLRRTSAGWRIDDSDGVPEGY